ncbi:MAG: NADPH-dependent F420 reductase [Anaerolineaceae bacterium]|nr:NADPH-dependent F420 reductase [Anaerolineaceae bacterium]
MTENETPRIETIAIVGGTGKEGKGLAYRWAKAGHKVIIGSRQIEKAQTAADEVAKLLPDPSVISGETNPVAAEKADLVVLTVPFTAHVPTLESIKSSLEGKILIDVTVPLVPPKVTKVQMPAAGSAAQEAQEVLGEGVQVVGAFQNISYEHLLNDEEVECDVLVSGSGKAARTVVLQLVEEAGMVGWDAGPIENSVIAEGLTSILIGLNKQFGVDSAGIRMTGLPRPEKKS